MRQESIGLKYRYIRLVYQVLHFYLWRAWNSVVKSTQSTRKLKSIWNLFDIWHASGNMIHVRVVCHCRSRVWRLKAVQMYLTFHHVLPALSGNMHSLWTKLYMDIPSFILNFSIHIHVTCFIIDLCSISVDFQNLGKKCLV